jgi:ubiquinone/menaquinone biosynthesis C-methylase UbiE
MSHPAAPDDPTSRIGAVDTALPGDRTERHPTGPGTDVGPGTAETTAAPGFDAMLAATANSATLRQISRDVFGPDYPEEAAPFSFVTLSDLRRMADELGVGPGQVMADLACGSGGPGLWVARETGASLVGIDFSRVGIEQARQRAIEFGLSERAQFLVRDVAATGLHEHSLDGAMSVDAFWLFPDKQQAAREIARLLQPGARFVFTTWEFEVTPPGWPPQLAQHHDVLAEAGFLVTTSEETPDWKRRELAVYERWLAEQDKLVAELGEVAAALIEEARAVPPLLEHGRRILVVARRL